MTQRTGGCRGALLNLGGTIGELYGPAGLDERTSAATLLATARLGASWTGHDIAPIDSTEIDVDAIERAGHAIAADRTSEGFILCCGTDLLEEIAYAASLLLPAGRPIVVTAAALPASAPGTDGPANLRRAAALIASGAARGTTVVMGDAIFAPSGIVKLEPQAVQPFAAMDGPIGRFRADMPQLFASPPAEDRFRGLPADACRARVAILTQCMGAIDSFVDPAALDGLVVAGAGAGGLSARSHAMLRDRYLSAMPVVLSTRCAFGFAVNPAVAKHALAAARKDGFLIDDYARLGAVQARIRLILEIGLARRKEA